MGSHDTSAGYRGNDLYTPTHDSSSTSRFSRIFKPTIDYFRNCWHSHSSPAYHPLSLSPSPAPRDTKKPSWIQVGVSVISAPRFRRYLLVYFVLALLGWAGWVLFLSPRLQERANLLYSLDPSSEKAAGGWFGKNSMPQFDDLIQVATLDPALLPAERRKGEKDGAGSRRRLVFVGDVHGCKEECEYLFPTAARLS